MTPGNAVEYTIPACLAPGYYIVRHETIALHAAWAYPGAQFYPGCHQLEVTGGGSAQPSDLVAFPGAYKAADPGVTYDAYAGESISLANLVSGEWMLTCLILSRSLRDPRPCCLHLLREVCWQ